MNNKQQLNKLEVSIIDWYKANYKNIALLEQLNNINLLNREYTGAGLYINISIEKDKAKEFSDSDFSELEFPLNGPQVESEDIDGLGEVILFQENGYISFFEVYSTGEFFKEHIDTFKLI